MAENFTPGETVSLTSGAASSTVAFSLAQSAAYPDCMITNAGSQNAFVAFGANAATVATTPASGALGATPVLAGETIILRKGVGNATCAALSPAGSTTLYFTAGQGN